MKLPHVARWPFIGMPSAPLLVELHPTGNAADRIHRDPVAPARKPGRAALSVPNEAGYDVTACNSGLELLTHLERSVLSGELPELIRRLRARDAGAANLGVRVDPP